MQSSTTFLPTAWFMRCPESGCEFPWRRKNREQSHTICRPRARGSQANGWYLTRCPLLPFLFSLVMTSDFWCFFSAKTMSNTEFPAFITERPSADDARGIYLDDWLAVAYMDYIAQAGANYGLVFNSRKSEKNASEMCGRRRGAAGPPPFCHTSARLWTASLLGARGASHGVLYLPEIHRGTRWLSLELRVSWPEVPKPNE